MYSVTRVGLVASGVMFVLVACGGGTPTTTVSGSAVKGPVDGATVTIKNASTGEILKTTTTKPDGTYTTDVTYAGDIIVEITGGSYTDETTLLKTTLATPMRAVLNANGGNVTGMVTPLTTMAFSAAFPTGNGVTSTGYKTAASNLASQFKLTGVDLTTSTPTVTGTTNEYGKALIGVSRYLKDNNATLDTLVARPLTTTEWTAFSGKFSAAYTAANGTAVNYTFDGATLSATVTGTGFGGGSAQCGVSVNVSSTYLGQTSSGKYDFCVSGLQSACAAGNGAMEQQLQADIKAAQAAAPAGWTSTYNYTYSSACAANAIAIKLL